MKICVVLLLVLSVASPAFAKTRKTKKPAGPPPTPAPLLSCELGGDDVGFLQEIAETQQMQIALAEVVKSRAQEGEIRMVARSLFEDGQTERAALEKLAAAKGFPLNASAPAPDPTLEKANGPKFDKIAIDLISKLENYRATTFQTGAASKDADIRAFVEAHSPAVQESLLLIAKLTGNSQSLPAPVAEKSPAN